MNIPGRDTKEFVKDPSQVFFTYSDSFIFNSNDKTFFIIMGCDNYIRFIFLIFYCIIYEVGNGI